jgi:DNA-binding NtrC family response regulator
VRELLEDFLQGLGYHVTTAGDAAQGMRALAASAPDIVLLDIVMPGLSGVDALPAIRAVAPRAAIIMISGTSDEALARRALSHGAFDYLRKPIDLPYLALTLETALAMQRLDF